MSDIVVARLPAAWTVRHRSILFERFDNRAAATRRAAELARLLRGRGETCRLVCEEGDAPTSPEGGMRQRVK